MDASHSSNICLKLTYKTEILTLVATILISTGNLLDHLGPGNLVDSLSLVLFHAYEMHIIILMMLPSPSSCPSPAQHEITLNRLFLHCVLPVSD